MYRDALSCQSSLTFVRSDSINSEATVQSAIAFEKCSQLFNMAALFSSLASHQVLALLTPNNLAFVLLTHGDVTQVRCNEKALEAAQELYQQAAGVLRYISECFVRSSSTDTQPQVLKTFMHLMLVTTFYISVKHRLRFALIMFNAMSRIIMNVF